MCQKSMKTMTGGHQTLETLKPNNPLKSTNPEPINQPNPLSRKDRNTWKRIEPAFVLHTR